MNLLSHVVRCVVRSYSCFAPGDVLQAPAAQTTHLPFGTRSGSIAGSPSLQVQIDP